MPADADAKITRRSFLGIPAEGSAHVSSLVIRARPNRLSDIVRRIGALSAAEVALSDPSGRIVVTLETRDENGIVAAMNAIHRLSGVVSVALVYHQIDA